MYFTNNVFGVNCGRFEMIIGNMFGGKSTALIDAHDFFKRQEDIRVKAASREGKQINPLAKLPVKPKLDNRYGEEAINTHDGRSLPASVLSTVDELKQLVRERNARLIVIDEIQFFGEKAASGPFQYEITQAVFEFIQENRYVIAAGLSKDFRGLPFGPMGELMAISDHISERNSQCAVCGGEAIMPQRFVNGEYASWEEPTIAVGNNKENDKKESYEPRCRRCHTIKEQAKDVIIQAQ